MHRPQGASGVPAVHHEREVQLRRALGNRDHVDLRFRQGRENAGSDAGRPRHPETHHDERRSAGAHFHAIDLLPRDLAPKRRRQALARPLRVLLGDAEADGLLGRRLADERDRDPFVVHRREGASRDAGDSEHPAPRHRQQGLLGDRGHSLHGIGIQGAPPRDLSPERRGLRERPDPHRDAAPQHRNQRPGVQHLRTVVRELGRFAHMELGDHARVGHGARVGGEHPRHVLPERDLARAEHPGEQRGREVRSAPTQGRHLPVGGGAEEPRDDRDDAAGEERPEHATRTALGAREIGRCVAEGAVGLDHGRGVHVRRRATGGVEGRRDQAGRQLLAARDQVIGGPGRQLAEDAQARGEGLDLRERVLDRLDELVRARTGTEQGTDGVEMLGAERSHRRAGAVRATLDRCGGELEQRVRDAGHRGHDDDHGRGPARLDDRHRLRDGGTARERGTAELVDLDGARGARHGGQATSA